MTETTDNGDRRREPLKVELTVVVKTGDAPEDRVTLMNNRELRMLGSVFDYRDRIMRFAGSMVWRVAAASPSFHREIAPGLFQYLDTVRRSRQR